MLFSFFSFLGRGRQPQGSGEKSTWTDWMMSVCRGSTPPIAEASSQWCCTEVKENKVTYVWTVKNFSLCPQKTGERLMSSIFTFGKYDWCLHLYPKGINVENKENLSVYLTLISCKSQVHVNSKFSILNAKGKETKSERFLVPHIFRHEEPSWGFPAFVSQNEAQELSVNDKLTISCEVSIIGETITVSGQSICRPVKVPECRLGEDLSQLFESSASSDVIVCVGDQEFRAHKVILTARSPVFLAMFAHEFRESISSRVVITDVEPDVMDSMLRFIYTGRAPNLDKMPEKLLAAADKYALKRLTVMCEEALCSKLMIDNACEILALADLHSADQLKSQAIDFINNHARDVMASAGWKAIMSTHPQLIAEAFSGLVSQLPPILSPPRKRVKKS